ncbi:hypothetical protein [Microbacterium sp. B19(2022)]|nr:hypothetical protein [Microbacterium sp. B19(2022)]
MGRPEYEDSATGGTTDEVDPVHTDVSGLLQLGAEPSDDIITT